MPTVTNEDTIYHTEAIKDIITATPSWLLRWGTIIFFLVLLLIFGLSAFIRYPDVVKAPLKINSANSPKPVVAKVSGKLVKLLIKQNEYVKAGQQLAYLESIADPNKALRLITNLKEIQLKVTNDKPISEVAFTPTDNEDFGELQIPYQTFFQSYLLYRSAITDGLYLKKKVSLQKDLVDITQQQQQLQSQKLLQQREMELADQELDMHKKLENAKVESKAEFRDAEGKYLSKKAPLIQTQASLISSNTSFSSKQREIIELDNQITQQKSQFLQAINSLLSQAEDWKNKYVLTAPQDGKTVYAGILQENQTLKAGQEILYINPGNEDFFGEMMIPQNNMGKVKIGQRVLVKLKSYPYEEYGMIVGRINYISDFAYKDSIFMSTVRFNNTRLSSERQVRLKNGMTADAEIITEDASLLSRVLRNVIKIFK